MLRNDTGPSAEDFTHAIDALQLEAEAYVETITSDTAEAARDVIARAQGMAKKVESARKEAKQPHVDAGREIDAEFKPLKAELDTMIGSIKRSLGAYLQEEERRRIAEAESARKVAEEAAAFAKEADGDIAERAAEFARKREQKAALAEGLAQSGARVESRAGIARAASLRTYRFAEITDAEAAARHFAKHPDILAAIEKVANAEIRAAKGGDVSIPGVAVKEEKRVA